MTASIDDVAPVKISGRFNPLSDKEGSDLVVDLQGMELVPVGPYSGKYLGYLIAKGKMKVEMKYRVVGRQLKSENKLTLDEFDFGDKTESKEATTMPVKLGFAIMRDRSGQIVFDVPIEGNLDDPNFHFGRVIGRAILNVLTKLITSPFKLLGGMFGGGTTADLSYAEFAPGISALAPAEDKKLDVLAKSLFERPALKLGIAGAVDTVADPAALRTAKLEAQMRLKKWTALKAKRSEHAAGGQRDAHARGARQAIDGGVRGRVPGGQRRARGEESEEQRAALPRRRDGAAARGNDRDHAGRSASARDRARESVPRLSTQCAREQDRSGKGVPYRGRNEDRRIARGVHAAVATELPIVDCRESMRNHNTFPNGTTRCC